MQDKYPKGVGRDAWHADKPAAALPLIGSGAFDAILHHTDAPATPRGARPRNGGRGGAKEDRNETGEPATSTSLAELRRLAYMGEQAWGEA